MRAWKRRPASAAEQVPVSEREITPGVQAGAHIVLVCRNSKKGELAREAVIRESGNNVIDLVLADLSSLQGG